MAADTRPYDPNHPIYQAIPDGVALWSGNASAVIDATTVSLTTHGEAPTIYVGDAGDPDWALTINGHTFTGVKAPADIDGGGGSDDALVILDEVNGVEYRMFQVSITGDPTYTVTCTSGGVGLYVAQKGIAGTANIHNNHTGSGLSFLAGMIRPEDIAAGEITHAIRAAAGFIGGAFVSPAITTDQSGTIPPEVPMGIRMFIDPSVDLDAGAISTAINAEVSTTEGRAAAHMILKAMQDYGCILSDGTVSGFAFYFEPVGTADWEPLIGAPNGVPSYNDIGRAVEAAIDTVAGSGWTDRDVIKFTDALDGPDGLTIPTHVSSHDGGTTTTTDTATITGVEGGGEYTYVLTVAHRTSATVSSVVGGGLTWTQVDEQDSSRGQCFGEVWTAYGTPSGDPFTITITMSTSVQTISALCSVFDGIDPEATPTWTSAVTGGTVFGDDNTEMLHTPAIPAGAGLTLGVGISRATTNSAGLNYTELGDADFTNAGLGGSTRIVVKHYGKDVPFSYAYDDLQLFTASAATDWIVLSATLPAVAVEAATAALNFGRARMASASPGKARIQGSRL